MYFLSLERLRFSPNSNLFLGPKGGEDDVFVVYDTPKVKWVVDRTKGKVGSNDGGGRVFRRPYRSSFHNTD